MLPDYPEARVDDVYETLAGVPFPDPYRWLEENSEEVKQWQHRQADLATSHVREWRGFERLHDLIGELYTGQPTLPRYAGGMWFRTQYAEGASQAHVVMANDAMGSGRILFDPASENRDSPPFLSWISPSPDGRILAVGICVDGSESNTIRLVDVDTGTLLPNPPTQIIMDSWTGGAQWLADSSGFFFNAITGQASELRQNVYLHRRLPEISTRLIEIPWIGKKNEYRMVVVSRDGAYAVAVERLVDPIPIAFSCIESGSLLWKPFITLNDGAVKGHAIGGKYIAVTDVGARRGRLVSISFDTADPNNSDAWDEIVPESESVLRTVTQVGEVLYLTELVDTYARVRIVDLNGRILGEVPLPGNGALREYPTALTNMAPKGHPDKFIFGFSSLVASPGIYCHSPGESETETLQKPRVVLEKTVVEDLWATSSDGTRIPYHLVRRADVESDRPKPTLVYGYGGFNIPLVPQYPGAMAAFIAAGGVFAHVHLRGGGEFGDDWWKAGRWENKQNSYNDLYAIAEQLIGVNRCTPELLAVTGGSNGGQMAAVAITQRPELWAVAVPRAPRLDLIGACRNTYGRQSTLTDRVISVDDPDEVRRLATFSPYHLVRDGIKYPAVYLDAGDTDPRCPAWEARKFAARLQRATKSQSPVLLHVWENVGHWLGYR